MSDTKQNDLIHVDELDPNTETSPIVESDLQGESTPAAPKKLCMYNGTQYATGAEICSGSIRLVCTRYGTWQRKGRC